MSYFDGIIKLEYFDLYNILIEEKSYLTLLGSKEYETIYNRISYLISRKSSITYIFFIYMGKSKLILTILYL